MTTPGGTTAVRLLARRLTWARRLGGHTGGPDAILYIGALHAAKPTHIGHWNPRRATCVGRVTHER